MPRLWQTIHVEKIFGGPQEGETQRDPGDIPLCALWQELLKKNKPKGTHGLHPLRQEVSLCLL